MAVIFPKYGQEKQTAQRLLALADNVHDVKTSTDNGLAFLVPEDLYERFLAVDELDGEDDAQVNPEQVKRRPGRPRKVLPEQPKEGD